MHPRLHVSTSLGSGAAAPPPTLSTAELAGNAYTCPGTGRGMLLLKLLYLASYCLKDKCSLLPHSVETKAMIPSASPLLSKYVVLVQLNAMSV